MNGGLAHALEVDVRLGRDAAKAYRAIGADDHAALIDEALNLASPAVDRADKFDSLNLGEEDAAELDQLDERLPEDSEVERIFRRYLDSHPDDLDRA